MGEIEMNNDMDMFMLLNRKCQHCFHWTPENSRKILVLNDYLFSLENRLYDEMLSMKTDYDRLIEEGNGSLNSYEITGSISYRSSALLKTADQETSELLYKCAGFDSFLTIRMSHDDLPPDHRRDSLMTSLNWNIEDFDQGCLDGHYICYLMHELFVDGPYSLTDALYMKPEDFHEKIEMSV